VVVLILRAKKAGIPPKKHVDAFHYIQRENFNITIHAAKATERIDLATISIAGRTASGTARGLSDDIGVDGKAVNWRLAQYVSTSAFPWRFAC